MTTTSPSNLSYDGQTIDSGDTVYQIGFSNDGASFLITLQVISINNNILHVGEIIDGKLTNLRNISVSNVHTDPIELCKENHTKISLYRDTYIPKALNSLNSLIEIMERNARIEGNEVI